MNREANEALAELHNLITEAIRLNDEAVLQDGYTEQQEARLDGLLASIRIWATQARSELRAAN